MLNKSIGNNILSQHTISLIFIIQPFQINTLFKITTLDFHHTMCKLGKWKSGMAKIWCGESLEWWMSDFVKVWFGESLEWQKSDVVKSGMVKVWFGESECHDTTCFFICFTVATRLLCPSREFFLWFYVSCIFWKYSSDPGWLKIYQCAEFTCWIRLNYVHDIIWSHCLSGRHRNWFEILKSFSQKS